MAQRNYNPPLSRKEYELAMLRSGEIRETLKREGIPIYLASARIHRNPQSVYRWLSAGLTEEQYSELKHAITELILAALQEGQGAVR